MINKVLQIIAPHHCYGCGKIGTTLCDNCKYDIAEEVLSACIVCMRPSLTGICEGCRTSYSRAWVVGERTDVLHDLIDGFKFNRVFDAGKSLASLLDVSLPVLPPTTIVVPVPTVPSHIRQRGYDHTCVIAEHFAKYRSLAVQLIVMRNSKTVQRGKSKKQRLDQAKVAYRIASAVDSEATYLLIDDVVTTNATLRYCAQALRDAGARNVWVAVIARQPIDK